MPKSTRFITTPIYYVNDQPHIGHVYTTTLCDIYARSMRNLGHDVFFLTGTDEHGQKIEQHAKEQKLTPQELADKVSSYFQDAMNIFNLSNDFFIRTTNPKHIKQVQEFAKKLEEKELIKIGDFEGWYDGSQEEYYTETKAKACNYISPITGKKLEKAIQKNYYFKLSSFQKEIESYYEKHPDFVRPTTRKNEILNRIREGLQDVPISRTNFSWGIPMPNDPEHVIYVWIDALFNYATALNIAENDKQLQRFWPADYHIVGKEILWFHAVIWPALLMALEMPLPKCIYAHSFWISEGQKMSKSLGNFVGLDKLKEIINTYGLDALRWYLATQGPIGSTDANFTISHFHEIYESNLVNTIGNCASRVTAMVEKYFNGKMPKRSGFSFLEYNWEKITRDTIEKTTGAIEHFNLNLAAENAISLIRKLDAFINETQPFKIAKDPTRKDELQAVLYDCLETLRISGYLLMPWMPMHMKKLLDELGEPPGYTLAERSSWGNLYTSKLIKKIALFPRIENI